MHDVFHATEDMWMEVPIEANEGEVRALGYGLDGETMLPNLWRYAAGDTGSWHRQTEQEEFYYVIEGEVELRIGDDETVSLDEGDAAVVSPEEWRQLRAVTDARLLVVGSPPAQDDHVLPEDEGAEPPEDALS